MKRMAILLVAASVCLAGCKDEPNNSKSTVSEAPSPTSSTIVTTYNATPQPTPEPSAEPIAEEDTIKMVATDRGFQLLRSRNEQTRELFATTVDNGSTYTVHIMATDQPGNAEGMIGRKALVVHPESGEFREYPLFRAHAEDSYAVDSLAMAYGFVDDRSLLYIAVHNDEENHDTYYYSVDKLDILTGEIAAIIPRIHQFDELPESEHFVKGWLTAAKDKLILNSYSEGLLWSIDTAGGDVKQLPAKVKHHWPFYMTSVSPDGERIWYVDSENSRYVLLDADGGILRSFPFPSESAREQYGWFFWSPTGKYAVNYTSSAANADTIIHEDSEFVTRAMESLTIYDREGNGRRSVVVDKNSGPYVEVAGWVGEEDEYAVLRLYDLEGTSGVRTPVNESYMLYDVTSGKSTALRVTPAEHQIMNLEPVILYQNRPGVAQPVLLIDRKADAVVILSEYGYWIPSGHLLNGATAWTRLGNEEGNAALLWSADGSFGDIQEQPLQSSRMNEEVVYAGESWLVLPGMTYMRLE